MQLMVVDLSCRFDPIGRIAILLCLFESDNQTSILFYPEPEHESNKNVNRGQVKFKFSV